METEIWKDIAGYEGSITNVTTSTVLNTAVQVTVSPPVMVAGSYATGSTGGSMSSSSSLFSIVPVDNSNVSLISLSSSSSPSAPKNRTAETSSTSSGSSNADTFEIELDKLISPKTIEEDRVLR